MTYKNERYPNEFDYELKVLHPRKGIILLDELPLADPSTSNSTDVFSKNAYKKAKEHKPSAYSLNKPKVDNTLNEMLSTENSPLADYNIVERAFNQQAHEKWNAQKYQNTSFGRDA